MRARKRAGCSGACLSPGAPAAPRCSGHPKISGAMWRGPGGTKVPSSNAGP